MQVLYDFSGEPGSAELTITAGQTLTVTRRDVGEGWWEGANEQGKTGLFPAAYVEVQSWLYHSTLYIRKFLFEYRFMFGEGGGRENTLNQKYGKGPTLSILTLWVTVF